MMLTPHECILWNVNVCHWHFNSKLGADLSQRLFTEMFMNYMHELSNALQKQGWTLMHAKSDIHVGRNNATFKQQPIQQLWMVSKAGFWKQKTLIQLKYFRRKDATLSQENTNKFAANLTRFVRSRWGKCWCSWRTSFDGRRPWVPRSPT